MDWQRGSAAADKVNERLKDLAYDLAQKIVDQGFGIYMLHSRVAAVERFLLSNDVPQTQGCYQYRSGRNTGHRLWSQICH
jgi:hypothetical protein